MGRLLAPYAQQALADRILAFQKHYQRIAQPFEWKFTRTDLHRLLTRCISQADELAEAA